MLHKMRIKSLQELIKRADGGIFYLEDKINLFYLTGLDLSAGILAVGEKEANLFVDSRYIEVCREHSPISVSLVEAATVEHVLAHSFFKSVQTLSFDSVHTTYQHFKKMEEATQRSQMKLVPLEDPVSTLRLIKDPTELRLLKEAAALGSSGYDYVLTLLKEGITEEEIALELEVFWRRSGGKSLAFESIIAFGANSSKPHYRPGKNPLKKGDTVLIDIGVNCNYYHSDMTRVVFFGEPHSQMLQIYQIVKDAQQAALDLCRPGILIGDLDKAARQHIAACGFGDYFSHGLGHGVGLEIHEAPWVRNRPPHNNLPLQPGMVITIEPGIYLPGMGGVRIEDCVAITDMGHDNLTNRHKDLAILYV